MFRTYIHNLSKDNIWTKTFDISRAGDSSCVNRRDSIACFKSHKYVRPCNGTDSEASVRKKRGRKVRGKNATGQKTLKELGSDC